jgi:hypothetical protein
VIVALYTAGKYLTPNQYALVGLVDWFVITIPCTIVNVFDEFAAVDEPLPFIAVT